MDWWLLLDPLNKWFFIGAMFFSVLFLWQLIMTIVGLSGGADIDTHVDSSYEHQAPNDAADTVSAFKILSVQSILSFFTLFTWAGALYMRAKTPGTPVSPCLLYAAAWGVAAMVIVSGVIYMMRRMTSSGNLQIEACVGTNATVCLDIPAAGTGEVRLLCNGVMTHLKARAAGGAALKTGAPVRVVRVAGPNTLEVEPSN